MSAPAFLFTVSAATATATALFLICNSRLMRVSPYEKNLTRHHRQQPKRNPEQPKRDPRGKMLFVSQIGTSKALATCLCDLLESKGVVLDLVDARDYEPEALPKENLVLLVASTSEVWNLSPARNFSSNHHLLWGAKFFVNWIQKKANAFKVGAFVVNACSFSAFVVGREVNEGGKNLMAKAANEIRGLGRTAESNADFDSWWGSVVAVLQGAVLGDAADGICGESEPEDVGSSDLKLSMTQRLYILVKNQDFVTKQTEPCVSFSSTTRHRLLTLPEDNFMKNGTVEPEEVCHIPAQWPLRDDLLIYDGVLPNFKGFCSVGRCFYFAGNARSVLTHPNVGDDRYYSKLWCLKYEDSTWVWSLCGTMFCSQLSPLVVPYDGKLCMFWGDYQIANWVEIYSLKSGLWEKREVPDSALFSDHPLPSSYFLWEDSTKSPKKTLIVLYSFHNNHQLLMSYDVKANRWEKVLCNFPPVPRYCPRKLVRLGCTHYLLIVDFAPMWYIYDLSKKKVVEEVLVDGLEKDVRVSNIFCCQHSSKESLIYIFTGHEEEEEFPQFISYARVRLQLQTFSAKIESKGHLRVGPYYHYRIFAAGDEGNKEKTVV
ncbi:uncharacterized protein [Arachis hypogaea]|uniref:uncharacterized protein n=1 Tax=Arachis hypogaea TaxID=3818 RepID=UPI000DED4DF6|nr:uncharacterized protein LOC112766806 [Arachis hypogaea]